ncbi:hypothetical protein ACQR22_09645 [Clostridium perfringens]|uniref:hypothetical protein n=1 Tax=Clostridium perfringens TaxID=1502 RepID=UPI001F56B3BA|nr:hypothetical protein [Clostridium perfringens]MCI2779607.1 hypothetical protein [Clostridium perfringens]MDK0979659.1 hypothetical protein [Clostridium perfringens]MDM0455154.1 hypothetical protein [Clostridium perfringens]
MNSNNEIDTKVIDSKIIDYGISINKFDDKIIKLFNLFLTSNPNYLYNKTYILDFLDDFKKNVETLKDKLNKSKAEAEKLKGITCKYAEWFAIVDDYFIIYPSLKNKCFSYCEFVDLLQKQRDKEMRIKLEKIKNIINKYIICNNLYNIKSNSTIRVFYNNFQMLFCNNKNNKIFEQIQMFIDDCDDMMERKENNG